MKKKSMEMQLGLVWVVIYGTVKSIKIEGHSKLSYFLLSNKCISGNSFSIDLRNVLMSLILFSIRNAVTLVSISLRII